MWHGNTFYGLGIQGFRVLFLLFCFVFAECGSSRKVFCLLKVSQACLVLAACWDSGQVAAV
jgi:hypothetical protein